MAKKTFSEKFDALDNHKKKVLTSYIDGFNDIIDFNPFSFSMVKFAKFCEMVLSELWQTENSASEISAELYMMLELFFKAGVFVGKTKPEKVDLTNSFLKDQATINNMLKIIQSLSIGRQN